MKNNINTMQSLAELRDFLRRNEYKVNEKDDDYVNQLIQDWDEQVLSHKLIEFHEKELAQLIDAINPSQSDFNICKEIYKIILEQQGQQGESSASSIDTQRSFWEEFFDYLLSHPGTRHI